MRKLKLLLLGQLCMSLIYAQETFPVNGVADKREGCYAFTNATIVKDARTTLQNATMVVKDGKITAIGSGSVVPKDAVVINCRNKYIYPSFIDIYTDYGLTLPQRASVGFSFNGPSQFSTATKGAYGWNQAIKPEVDAFKIFSNDESKAKPLREMGFGTVLTHVKDGIARGTGAIVTLADKKENLVVLKEKASAHYSFNKGSSTQSYPGSLMGSIALLRQTYLDALWYRTKPSKEGTNLSLEAWNDNQNLPQIFEANDKWNDLRADRIGDEFGVQYIIKGGGNEYQRIDEIAATKATYIISLNFPQAMDVEDPYDARSVSLADMKHWELAPTNPAVLEKANIPFVLTTADTRDNKQFFTNLRQAIDLGLSEAKALDALTKVPAILLHVYDQVGSLETGKVANFLVTSGPVFKEKTVILQNWIQGEKYAVNESGWDDSKGVYNLVISSPSGTINYQLDVKNNTTAKVIGKDTLTSKFNYDNKSVKLSFSLTPLKARTPVSGVTDSLSNIRQREGRGGRSARNAEHPELRLTGFAEGNTWNGYGEDTAGRAVTWTAVYLKSVDSSVDTTKKAITIQPLAKVTYPFGGYGWEELPKQEDLLIKNATVWTNEKEGILQNTDVLIKDGKIKRVGKNLSDASATIIDGTGKHLTAGIIDEHSHIAVASINEAGHSVTSEVRIGDNLNPEDINIYRQLSGGVTSSHILHGSANTIGGQTQLIKLRWGSNDENLKFKGADPFIKFALGENVKQNYMQNNNRFPDTRMGVDQVMNDAFSRAKDYEAALKADSKTRRDLQLETLVEIMNKKRFITCHSYVQSEITAAMRIAEKYGFKINTFTHILEGYKVADKMKEHGANTSTFSDWWAYKEEVRDAIAYNAAVMQKMGLNVCINSDDAEQARRLNQEAAKTIKYGGISEEDALKMVTLNPAKALHVADKTGSIKVGKDADLVLWSYHPLSIYAEAEKTIVDGIVYFDRNRDMELKNKIFAERNRLIQKMIGDKKGGAPVRPAEPSVQVLLSCGDHGQQDALTTGSSDDNNTNQ